VFTHGAPKHFFTIIKQHGALVAKGRLIGLQFDALFTDHLYLNISKHAIDMAMRMKQMFIDKGYKLFIDSPTNQQFVIIPNDKVRQLEKQVIFTHWEPYKDDSLVCRFVTSWATTEEQMNYLESIL
jgi:threonine aldolase